MNVEVTQFILPNGRKEVGQMDASNDCKDKYEQLIRSGCRLTAEILRTGEVSLCIEFMDTAGYEGFDYDCKISNNGPEITSVLSNMILNFDTECLLDRKLAQIGV